MSAEAGTPVVIDRRYNSESRSRRDGRWIAATCSRPTLLRASRRGRRFGRTTRQDNEGDRKSTRLNSSHIPLSRMPASALKKKDDLHQVRADIGDLGEDVGGATARRR